MRRWILIGCVLAAACGDGDDGAIAMISTATEPAGDNCDAGGTRVTTGIDDDGSGVLDASEADSTFYVCDGASGQDGANGNNGSDGEPADSRVTLVDVTSEPVGDNCAFGGTAIRVGVDSNGNGELEVDEVTDTAFVCQDTSSQASLARFATYNASLNFSAEGEIATALADASFERARAVAEIIQRTRPDVLLINEFDYYAAAPEQPAQLLRDNFLSVAQNGAEPIDYPYVFVAPSNTGIDSGLDLDNNGELGQAGDAFGFGAFPGQYGMLLLSRYPIATADVRTFQNFLWVDMPGARLPDDATTEAPNDFYTAEERAVLRLSSKSHWDVPVHIDGHTIHALVSHPTPPVFDGPEDRNGLRNADEIRLLADYVSPGAGGYIYDDAGMTGGLPPGAAFVIMGDMNADPFDGDSTDAPVEQLVGNRWINAQLPPTSAGAVEDAIVEGGVNDEHLGDPALDTADFGGPGNLRVDYVLPSVGLRPVDAGVFWPLAAEPTAALIEASDHRLVWLDLVL